MRLAAFLILALCAAAQAPDGEQQAVIRAVERTFEAMAARDAAALRKLLLPDARFHAVRPDGALAVSSMDEFITRISSASATPLERMWNPVVLLSGRLAALWAEYDFHRGGQFSHCGVDAVTLVKTPEGWKITGIAYTVEKEKCPPSPLGPPRVPSPAR